VHPEEDWMLMLTDQQPSDAQQFTVHRWGSDQVQILAPNGKVRGRAPCVNGPCAGGGFALTPVGVWTCDAGCE
jgi:hypothetical protein